MNRVTRVVPHRTANPEPFPTTQLCRSPSAIVCHHFCFFFIYIFSFFVLSHPPQSVGRSVGRSSSVRGTTSAVALSVLWAESYRNTPWNKWNCIAPAFGLSGRKYRYISPEPNRVSHIMRLLCSRKIVERSSDIPIQHVCICVCRIIFFHLRRDNDIKLQMPCELLLL